MKVAFITPTELAGKLAKIVFEEFSYVDLTVILYKHYRETPQLICSIQKEFDVLLFAGAASYQFAKEYVKQSVIWECVPITSSALYHALLEGVMKQYDISRISYEYTSASLQEVYNELETGDSVQIYSMKQEINIEDDHFLNPDDDEEAYRFHCENFKLRRTGLCLTTRYLVGQRLSNVQIPNVIVYPTYDSLRQSLLRARVKFLAEANRNSQLVVLSIGIWGQGEYSVDSRDEYQLIVEKAKVAEQVYLFAQKIKAAVCENPAGNYLLFTTKSIIEAETDHFQSFELVRGVSCKTYKSLVIGVGYGETAFDAKYNAYLALEKAQRAGKDSVFVVYGDGSILGPICQRQRESSDERLIDEKLLKIAERSQTSVNAIVKLNRIMNQCQKDCFTTQELARYYAVSARSMNRTLQKLEAAGYVSVIGKKMMKDRGRPTRIVRLHLE